MPSSTIHGRLRVTVKKNRSADTVTMIELAAWRRYAHFGDGFDRPAELAVPNIEDAVRDRLRCATRLARHVLQS
jgi:hypothetical protein